MFTTLMKTRRFAPLFWCQLFSAFNDNFLKNSLVFLILFKLSGPSADSLITLAGAVLMFPFFILSAIGGEIADRYDKAYVAERLKRIEIAVAALAVAGFWLHSIPVLFVALFLFGVIEALFGPIKYGILPDHLARSELPAGNALIESATFIAILAGTIAGGIAAGKGPDQAAFASVMMVFALATWLAARLIPPSGRAAPDLKLDFNIARSTYRLLAALKAEPRLWWGGLVASWFWLIGAVALSLLPPLVQTVIGGDDHGDHRISRRVCDRDRRRVRPRLLARAWPHRPVSNTSCRGAACDFCARSRLDHVEPDTCGHKDRTYQRSSNRAPGSISLSISPGSPSRAGCSLCRRSRPFRPGPAPIAAPAWSPRSTCSMPHS